MSFMNFLIMDRNPSRSQQLTRSPSARRTHFTFLAGRKKKTVARVTSVRRNQSVRRNPSQSVATSRRHSRRESKLASPHSTPKNLGSRSNSVDRSSPYVSTSIVVHSVHTISSTASPMAKDSELPPLPAEATNPQSETQKTGAGIFKRFTTRLRAPSTSNSSQPAASSSRTPPAATSSGDPAGQTKRRKPTLKLPSMPAPPKASPKLMNSITSPESRQAALRERGLIPAVPHPYKDAHGYKLPLSEQEAELDRRRTVIMEEPGRSSDEEDVESEAKKIREAWLRKNVEAQQDQPSQDPPSSTSRSEELQQEETNEPQRGNSFSASERAFALAVPEDNMVIGTQQSPRRGTFVKVHNPALITPITLDLQTPADDTTTNTRFTAEPQEMPLPTSPSPNLANEPASPSSEEKVTKWLKSTPTASLTEEPAAPASPRSTKSNGSTRPQSPIDSKSLPMIKEHDPPASAQSTIKSPKSKPSPISVTAVAISTSQSAPPTAIPLSLASPPLAFDDPRSPRQATLPTLSISPPPPSATPTRGRSMTVVTSNAGATSLAPSSSTGSESRSRVPALSPTRTTSSSFSASEVPPTPTTSFVRPRKSSVVSDESAESRHRQVKVLGLGEGGLKIRTAGELGVNALKSAGGAIIESPIEGISDFGERTGPGYHAVEVKEPLPTPRPRPPQKANTEYQERRKSISFGLFGKGSSNTEVEKQPKPARSMNNLRRSVAGTISAKLRPKSTLVVDTSAKPDLSNLPPSPSLLSPRSPGSISPGSRSQAPGVGLRPRQALSPTIHNRGSILLSTKNIEDDESRRLSEMAFLDF